MRHSQWKRGQNRSRARRKGQAVVIVGLLLPVLLGMAAYSVDLSYLYKRRADAQKAADAAALAGALQYKFRGNVASTRAIADAAARAIAKKNGFDSGTSKVTVVTTNPWKNDPNEYHVVITSQEPVFFAGIFGRQSSQVAASATAYYSTPVQIPIDPQFYGLNTGPVTYSLYGPDGLHSNGDHLSVKLLDDGSPNPEYKTGPDGVNVGYNFTVSVPSDYAARNGTSQVQVDIFDPDCYNLNGNPDASATTVDELRTPTGTSQGTLANATTTRYSLIWDKDGNPDNPDPNDHQTIATQSYGNVTDTDMKWVTPPGFTFDASQYPTGNVRVNVASTAGSSENGFNLRAGPPITDPAYTNTTLPNGEGTTSNITDAQWHDQYSGAPGTTGAGKNGTNIEAQGNLPMNFNIDGTADIILGYVPPTAANGQFTITKFDTDVGAQSVYYTCDSLPGQQFPGTLAGNDQFATDTIQLPANYQGGTWHAIYTAGADDTSGWTLSYGHGNGSPGNILLVE
ncbi:MAG: hypothetical protein JO316_24385 [Abitibacteriaceae bacterium]|nr:hypothetical protein [Abditibacteriaceae bacterium]